MLGLAGLWLPQELFLLLGARLIPALINCCSQNGTSSFFLRSDKAALALPLPAGGGMVAHEFPGHGHGPAELELLRSGLGVPMDISPVAPVFPFSLVSPAFPPSPRAGNPQRHAGFSTSKLTHTESAACQNENKTQNEKFPGWEFFFPSSDEVFWVLLVTPRPCVAAAPSQLPVSQPSNSIHPSNANRG